MGMESPPFAVAPRATAAELDARIIDLEKTITFHEDKTAHPHPHQGTPLPNW